MIPEQVRVTHVRLQHVHALVLRHVAHLENRSAAARCAGQEAGPQGMGAKGAAYFAAGRFWLALDCDVPAPRILPQGSALAFWSGILLRPDL